MKTITKKYDNVPTERPLISNNNDGFKDNKKIISIYFMVVRHHRTSNSSHFRIYYNIIQTKILCEKRMPGNLCKCSGVPNLKFGIRALLLKIQTEVLWAKILGKSFPLFNERMMTIMIIIIIINC